MIDYGVKFGPFEELKIPEFLRRSPLNEVSRAPVPDGSPLPSRKNEVASKLEADVTSAPATEAPQLTLENVTRLKKENAFGKLRARAAAKSAIERGMVWRNGRFVHRDSMTRARYIKVLNDLPTPSMKRLFVHLYSERVL